MTNQCDGSSGTLRRETEKLLINEQSMRRIQRHAPPGNREFILINDQSMRRIQRHALPGNREIINQ